MVRHLLLGTSAAIVMGGSAAAQEASTFLYDVQGRLIGTTRAMSGSSIPSTQSAYVYDDADNRNHRTVATVPLRANPARMNSGHALLPQQQLISSDSRFTLQLQPDGNLVLRFGSTLLWASNTYGQPALALTLRTDGNLVLTDPANAVLWQTSTAGNPGAQLTLQNDGNLVLKAGATTLWQSNTCCH
jgi:YD repeat-containing protein